MSLRSRFWNWLTSDQNIALTTNALHSRHNLENKRRNEELIISAVATCLRVRSAERGVLKYIVKLNGDPAAPAAKALQKVLNRPNHRQTRIDFNECASLNYDVFGNVLTYVVFDGKFPCEIWQMPAYFFDIVQEEFDSTKISCYRWTDGRVIIPPRQIMHMKLNEISTMPYKGRGIVDSSKVDIELMNLVHRAQRNAFSTGGMPKAVALTPKGSILTEDQMDDLQSRWNAKFDPNDPQASLGILLDGMTLASMVPQELDYNATKLQIYSLIRESFQMPRIMLGDTDNVNYNNGQTAIAMFERSGILRYGQKQALAWEDYFCRQVDSRITVDIDPKILASFTQLDPGNSLRRTINETEQMRETALSSPDNI